MSSNLKYKQVANVERRTWDVEEYDKKAQARAAGAKAGDKRPLDAIAAKDDDEKEEFRPAEKGAAGPERSKRAFLKARRGKVDIDSKVGSMEIVSAEAAATTSTKLSDDATGSIKVRTGVAVLAVVVLLWNRHACRVAVPSMMHGVLFSLFQPFLLSPFFFRYHFLLD